MSSKSKRPCEEVFASCKALLFDVEGTTTSISFVKDKLFPYVRSNLETYVKKQWSSEEFKTDLTLLREQAVKDVADKVEGCVPIPDDGSDIELQTAVIANVLWQMDGDRKTKALKQLQGHLMREGYEQGKLKGHLYSDVAPAMQAWVENGLKLYIYSSGSVEAQKLLFGHSEQGNLLKMFEGHFDTEIGSKQDVASYASISKQVSCSPSEVIFFTDIPAEAMAAEGAGMTAVLVAREENAPLSEDDRALYQVIDSFDGFLCESPLKRRKVADDTEVLSTDVEMNDVSAATPDTPSSPGKPVEKETTNEVETDTEKKIEANTDVPMTECKPPTVEKPQTFSEEKESTVKDIEASKCNGLEMVETKNSKPEEDTNKKVAEAEHTSKDQSTSDQAEIKNDSKLTCVEDGEPTKLSTSTVEAPTETESKEPEAPAENNEDGQKVEEPQIVPSKGEKLEVTVEEKAIPEKTVIEEDKVTKVVKDTVVQLEASQDKVTAGVEKNDSDEEKVALIEVKEVAEEKEAPSSIDKIEEKVEKMEENVSQPIDGVVSKDTETIIQETTVEPNSSADDSGSIDKNNAKVDTLKKIDIADTKIESEKSLEKNSITEANVVSSVPEKIEDKMDCELPEKVDTIKTKEEVAEKVDTIKTKEEVADKVDTIKTKEKVAEKVDTIDKPVSEKEVHTMETNVSEKSDIVATCTGNGQEADKPNTGVEMGQGDAGTLVELSKNVENGKDSMQVEEIKVKKVLADNASDDTENAVPVTMET